MYIKDQAECQLHKCSVNVSYFDESPVKYSCSHFSSISHALWTPCFFQRLLRQEYTLSPYVYSHYTQSSRSSLTSLLPKSQEVTSPSSEFSWHINCTFIMAHTEFSTTYYGSLCTYLIPPLTCKLWETELFVLCISFYYSTMYLLETPWIKANVKKQT